MKQYIISIDDNAKANQLLAILSDLSYVKIVESIETGTEKDSANKLFPLMDNPIPVENFKHYSREELHER